MEKHTLPHTSYIRFTPTLWQRIRVLFGVPLILQIENYLEGDTVINKVDLRLEVPQDD